MSSPSGPVTQTPGSSWMRLLVDKAAAKYSPVRAVLRYDWTTLAMSGTRGLQHVPGTARDGLPGSEPFAAVPGTGSRTPAGSELGVQPRQHVAFLPRERPVGHPDEDRGPRGGQVERSLHPVALRGVLLGLREQVADRRLQPHDGRVLPHQVADAVVG